MSEEILDAHEHHAMIRNRDTLEITGIKKIISLNPVQFILDTIVGKMVIRGESLEIYNVDIDTGNLSLKGKVHGVSYDDATIDVPKKKKESVMHKLFK